jgi:hypothetical protein
MAIVLDTKQTYIWDDANSVWVNATINVGVSKII